MSFEDDLIDLPARINRYRDAGYDRAQAAKMARTDALGIAEKVLMEDYANPVTVEIENLDQVPVESVEDDIIHERLETAVEVAAITNACVRHRIGMSDTNYKLLAALQNHLFSKGIGSADVMPKLESIHAEAISPMQLTIHMEDTSKFSMKEMWQKLKQSFINAFNRIKSWYIKAFDATNRLGKKAAAVKQTAENKQGTMNNNTFDFSGMKQLAMNNKAPDPAQFAQSIQSMSGMTMNILGKNAEYYNKLTENMDKALQELIKQVPKQAPAQQGNNTTQQQQPTGNQADFTTATANNNVMTAIMAEVGNVQKALGGDQNLEPWTNAGQDERFKDLASSGNATFYKSKAILPGDKMAVISVPNVASANGGQSGASDFKDMKLAFGCTVEPINPKPREMEDNGQFRTLNTSQIISICDSVMEACKVGLDYKLLFAQRDKAFQTLGKQLEQTVNQAENLQGPSLTFARANISACTAIFNKINSGEGRWFRYAMGVFSKAVDYSQQSLNQIQ